MNRISSARLRRLNKLQVSTLNKNFIENPELLVGMLILHRVRENNDVEAT